MAEEGESQFKACRLYVKGTVLGFKRGARNQYCHTSLIKIEGVEESPAVDFYLGKRIAYIYKAHTEKKGTKFRVIWGRVMRAHGSSGVGAHLHLAASIAGATARGVAKGWYDLWAMGAQLPSDAWENPIRLPHEELLTVPSPAACLGARRAAMGP